MGSGSLDLSYVITSEDWHVTGTCDDGQVTLDCLAIKGGWNLLGRLDDRMIEVSQVLVQVIPGTGWAVEGSFGNDRVALTYVGTDAEGALSGTVGSADVGVRYVHIGPYWEATGRIGGDQVNVVCAPVDTGWRATGAGPTPTILAASVPLLAAEHKPAS